VLFGPSIRVGTELTDVDIYDVAPTVLALMELPASTEMVGRVLDEAFVEVPQLGEGPASYRSNPLKLPFLGNQEGDASGEEALQRMLEELGYVDRPGESQPRPEARPPVDPTTDPTAGDEAAP
jgi:hypothetical protein